MVWFVPFLMYASAAAAALGAIQQGVAARKAGKANAIQARTNASIARANAASAAVQQRRENYLRIGAMRANAGASGIIGGSMSDLLLDAETQGDLQVQNLLTRGEQEAAGFESTGRMDLVAGRSAQIGGVLSAAGSLMGGIAAGMDAKRVLSRD